jgi:hypothetical protein
MNLSHLLITYNYKNFAIAFKTIDFSIPHPPTPPSPYGEGGEYSRATTTEIDSKNPSSYFYFIDTSSWHEYGNDCLKRFHLLNIRID